MPLINIYLDTSQVLTVALQGMQIIYFTCRLVHKACTLSYSKNIILEVQYSILNMNGAI